LREVQEKEKEGGRTEGEMGRRRENGRGNGQKEGDWKGK